MPIATFSTVGSANWTVPAGVTSVAVLVVAGGGAGGNYAGAGGGAGGVIYQAAYNVTPGASISYTVGAGGVGRASQEFSTANNGGDSAFGSITATGGGGGGANSTGANGGSGGGGSWSHSGGTGVAGQGYAGGSESGGYNDNWTGGGGGAGGVGFNGDQGANAGKGGPGIASNITGSTVYYGGGGGGGGNSGAVAPGGVGGGGNGGDGSTTASTSGAPNTGGGGGGEWYSSSPSGSGGSGVVIVSWSTGDISAVRRHYSGPLYFVKNLTRGTRQKNAYSGPGWMRGAGLTSASQTSRRKDYTGPMAIRYFEPGHYYYDVASDWTRWGGNKRFDAQYISLLGGDMYVTLGVTNPFFYYKFAATQNVSQAPTGTAYNGVLDAPATYTNGLDTGTAGSFRTTQGIAPNQFHLLDSSVGSTKNVFAMAGFVKWKTGIGNKTIWGYHQYAPSSGGYYYYGGGYQAEVQCELANDGSDNLLIAAQHANSQNGNADSWLVAKIPPATLGLVNNQEHYIHVDMAVEQVSLNYFGNVNMVVFYVYIDGNLMAKVSPGSNLYYYPSGTVKLNIEDSNGNDGFLPAIGALSTTQTTPGTQKPPFGDTLINQSWGAYVNDVWWANWNFLRPAGLKPKYLITCDYNGTNVQSNSSWTTGSEAAYTIAKSLNPANQPESKFIVYGPVENFGSTATMAKFRVWFTLAAPTSGQQVLVSYRASNTSFTADAASPAWSNWVDVTTASGAWQNVTGVTGRYSQIRMKLLPSNDAGNTQMPKIDIAEYWMNTTPVTSSGNGGLFLTLGKS